MWRIWKHDAERQRKKIHSSVAISQLQGQARWLLLLSSIPKLCGQIYSLPHYIKCLTFQVHASSELMQDLTAVTASLARFQQLAFPNKQTVSATDNNGRPTESSPHFSHTTATSNALRPASFPSPAPSPPYNYAVHASHDYNPPSRKRFHREDSPSTPASWSLELPPPRLNDSRSTSRTRSPSLGSDCCGGIVDCRDLVEEEDDDMSDDDDDRSPIPRTSLLRTTSDYRPLGSVSTSVSTHPHPRHSRR